MDLPYAAASAYPVPNTTAPMHDLGRQSRSGYELEAGRLNVAAPLTVPTEGLMHEKGSI